MKSKLCLIYYLLLYIFYSRIIVGRDLYFSEVVGVDFVFYELISFIFMDIDFVRLIVVDFISDNGGVGFRFYFKFCYFVVVNIIFFKVILN